MSNAEFKRNFSKLLARVGDKAELVVRKTALELQGQMIQRSPVDTGRFKGNWQCGIGAVNADASAPTGTDAAGKTLAALPAWKPGVTIYLTNSLPYARKLEHGHSKQAPYGMVKLTIQAYSQALAKVVKGLK